MNKKIIAISILIIVIVASVAILQLSSRLNPTSTFPFSNPPFYSLPFTIQDLSTTLIQTPAQGYTYHIPKNEYVPSIVITNNQTFPVRVYVAIGYDVSNTYYVLDFGNSIFINTFGTNSTQVLISGLK